MFDKLYESVDNMPSTDSDKKMLFNQLKNITFLKNIKSSDLINKHTFNNFITDKQKKFHKIIKKLHPSIKLNYTRIINESFHWWDIFASAAGSLIRVVTRAVTIVARYAGVNTAEATEIGEVTGEVIEVAAVA